MKNILLCLIVLGATQSLMAKTSTNQDRGKQSLIEGIDIPISQIPQKKVVRDRMEMNTGNNAKTYKDIQFKRNERAKVLNEVFDPMILMTPVVRTIRPVDMIGISPTFVTQIILPKEMVVVSMVPSFKTNIFSHKANTITVQPDSESFYMGNIIVSLTDGKRNYSMTIFMERYFRDDCEEDRENRSYVCRKKRERGIRSGSQEKYAYSYNNLSSVYKYVEPKTIDGMQAIIFYERINKKLLNLKKDGDFVLMNYDGVLYRIERDETNGDIVYRNKSYILLTPRSTQSIVE